MGHVVEETLNPEWDTKAEFFTLDYTKVNDDLQYYRNYHKLRFLFF